jgi:hypothetical protein
MAQNPNINFTSGNSTINVKGTIINASKFIGDPLTYSAGKPVDANSKDPLIKGLNYTINVDTGQVKYNKDGVNYNSLNDYAKSRAVNFAGYDAFTTQNIQYAMQKNLASAIGAQGPTGGPPVAPSGGGGDVLTPFLNNLGVDVDTLKLDKDLNFKFGAVDDVIKKMPLLNYPEDALYNKTQDYLSIAQYSYKPPRSNDIFGDALDTLRNGSKRTSPLKDLLGMVNLPMPNNITDSNNVSWADDNMNNLSAALTSYVTQDPLKTLAGAAGLRAGASALGVGGGAAQIASLLGSLASMGAFKTGATPAMKTLLGGAVNSQILGMLGVSVSPESILARGYGIVPNSNLELLFNAPTLREFTFQYRMSPRSSSEAKIINNIIRFFKQGMAAKKISSISGGGSAGAQSYFLGTPNVFQLQYKTTGGKTIKGVNRIKTCALTGFAMNYAADGNWAAYDEGQPVSVIMNMSFKELEPVYDTDYQENVEDGRLYEEGKSDTGDLYPISDDEVGY